MGTCCLIKNEGAILPVNLSDELDHISLPKRNSSKYILACKSNQNLNLEVSRAKRDFDPFLKEKCKSTRTSKFNPNNDLSRENSEEKKCRTLGGNGIRRIKLLDNFDDFSSLRLSMNNTDNSKVLETEKTFSNCEYSLKLQLLPSSYDVEKIKDFIPSNNQLINNSTTEISPNGRSALKKTTNLSKANRSNLSIDEISANSKSDKKLQKVRFGFT